MEKAIVVEIADLCEVVGGASDVTIADLPLGHAAGESKASANGTAMCSVKYTLEDSGADWMTIKGQ